MGYSGWTHIDFKQIVDETVDKFCFHFEDGEITWVPKRQIAYRKDYHMGDKNGCVSVKDDWYEKHIRKEVF